jgi:WD40 repeat protein
VSFVIKSKEVDEKHRFGINSLKVDRDRKLLYTAGRDAIIRKWDASASEKVCVCVGVL